MVHKSFQPDRYTLSTPYGIVSVAEGGRKVTFELFPDVRESIHHKALFHYCQNLRQRGIVAYNVAHIDLPGLDKTLDLRRGRAYLDLVYRFRGKLYECELKTNREVGIDRTATHLAELAKHCENLIVLVPAGSMPEMATILKMIHLDQRIKIDSYDTPDPDAPAGQLLEAQEWNHL